MSRSFVGRVERRSVRGVSARNRGVSNAVAMTVEALEGRQLLAGNIAITTAPLVTDTNLTNEGNLDWIHLGNPDTATRLHRKQGVSYTRISRPTVTGTPTAIDTPGKTF